jgi:hypothetical protein
MAVTVYAGCVIAGCREPTCADAARRGGYLSVEGKERASFLLVRMNEPYLGVLDELVAVEELELVRHFEGREA